MAQQNNFDTFNNCNIIFVFGVSNKQIIAETWFFLRPFWQLQAPILYRYTTSRPAPMSLFHARDGCHLAATLVVPLTATVSCQIALTVSQLALSLYSQLKLISKVFFSNGSMVHCGSMHLIQLQVGDKPKSQTRCQLHREVCRKCGLLGSESQLQLNN